MSTFALTEGPCSHCHFFDGWTAGGTAARCIRDRLHVRATPETGCVFWEREPGADDDEIPPPSGGPDPLAFFLALHRPKPAPGGAVAAAPTGQLLRGPGAGQDRSPGRGRISDVTRSRSLSQAGWAVHEAGAA
jgi:hypothetical protein